MFFFAFQIAFVTAIPAELNRKGSNVEIFFVVFTFSLLFFLTISCGKGVSFVLQSQSGINILRDFPQFFLLPKAAFGPQVYQVGFKHKYYCSELFKHIYYRVIYAPSP